jgi:hypothetical protein
MRQISAAALLALLAAGPCLAAQEAPVPAPAPRAPRAVRGPETPRAQALPNPGYDGNAQETQQRLQEILRAYPPSISEVLVLDPTLLTNDAYLQLYPQLSSFLAQHPEIAHNPGYFLPRFRNGGPRNYDGYNEPRVVALRTVGEGLAGLAFLIGFLTVVGTIGYLLRSAIEHRKWLRVSKTHVDTHTRIMERLTSNDDLLAYMQSPSGQRFLNAAPIPIESGPRTLAAPFGRILLSVQAGVVIAFLGGGLIYASGRFSGNEIFSEAELPLFVVGATAVAVGVGFFVSAVMAYGLSRRLGLFDRPAPSDAIAGTGQQS